MNALAIILIKGQADAFLVCTNVRASGVLRVYCVYLHV